MIKQILFGLLLITSLTYFSCNKEDETKDQTDVYNLTFKAEHHGPRFKGHYRFLIVDSKDNFKYDKQDYVQNTSISMTTKAIKGDKVYIYAENPMVPGMLVARQQRGEGLPVDRSHRRFVPPVGFPRGPWERE